MKRRLGLLAGLTVACATNAGAATFVFNADLTGEAERPMMVTTLGTGVSIVTFDDVANSLTIQATFSGLLGNTTMAHIHCCTPPTGAAGVATTVPTLTSFPLGVTSGGFSQTLDLNLASSFNPTFVTANGGTLAGARDRLVGGLFANQTYLNIHTSRFPGGEIRGNLVAAVPEPATWGMMILGFGAVGYSLRSSRRRTSLSSELIAGS